MKRVERSLLFIAGWLLLAASSALAENVTIQNGRISVDLKEASILDIAKDIEKNSGVTFKGDDSLLEEKVSVYFKDLPLDEGIRRILANLNYTLMYDNRGEVSEVRIISEGTGASQQQIGPAPARAPSPVERRPFVRRPGPSSPLVTGGGMSPTARTRPRPSRTVPQRSSQTTPPAIQIERESNLPEAFRTIEEAPSPEAPVSSEGPLPPAFQAIENEDASEEKTKGSPETPPAITVKKRSSSSESAAEGSREKTGEEEDTKKEDASAKNPKP